MSTHVALVLAVQGEHCTGCSARWPSRDGEPLVTRAARLALATGPLYCIVVLGQQATDPCDLLDGLPVRVVHAASTTWPGEAMGAPALHEAIWGDPVVERCLVLGCGQPALESGHLATLLAEASGSRSGCAVSGYDGVRGLPAVVRRQQWERVSACAEPGLRRLIASLDPETLGCVVAPALGVEVANSDDIAIAVSRGWLDPQPRSVE